MKSLNKNIIILASIVLELLLTTATFAQTKTLSLNIPLLITGSLNAEHSFVLSKRYSCHTMVSWNPFEFSKEVKIKHLNALSGIRLWHWHTYSGFFNGAYISGAVYNVGYNSTRYQGHYYGVGTTLGYAKMLSKDLNMEFEAGVCASINSFDMYEIEPCGEFLDSTCKFCLLPFKLSISLVYVF